MPKAGGWGVVYPIYTQITENKRFICDKKGRFREKTAKMRLFRFCLCLSLKYQYITKIEKTKSKKIGRLRKGARENSKIHKSFLFTIILCINIHFYFA